MSRAKEIADEASTVDAYLGGRVILLQPRKGHRAGLDAALLQALVPAGASGCAVDLGAGIGTVAFCIAARAPALSAIGIERDSGLVALGLEALTRPENAGFADRVRLIEADAADARVLPERIGLARESVDWVLMNPPFVPESRGTPSPDARRRDAYLAAEGLLESWVATAATMLKRGGSLCLIYRADALPGVLAALSPHFGAVRVLPVHPSEGAAATRVLVKAQRGSLAPFGLLPGLVLHREDGAWTPRADAILRGQAELLL